MKIFLYLLLSAFSGAALAADQIVLPGENVLGQTYTDCHEGKANNDPRKVGQADIDDSVGDDSQDGGKTQDI